MKYVCCGGCRQWLMAPRDAQFVVCSTCESINNCNLAPKVSKCAVILLPGRASVAYGSTNGVITATPRLCVPGIILFLTAFRRLTPSAGKYSGTQQGKRATGPRSKKVSDLCPYLRICLLTQVPRFPVPTKQRGHSGCWTAWPAASRSALERDTYSRDVRSRSR